MARPRSSTRRAPLEAVLDAIGAWASDHGVEVGQVRVDGQTRVVADAVEPADCDLLVAVGGDGTTLAALHAGRGRRRGPCSGSPAGASAR